MIGVTLTTQQIDTMKSFIDEFKQKPKDVRITVYSEFIVVELEYGHDVFWKISINQEGKRMGR